MSAAPQFHSLSVLEVRPETNDSISVSFDVPPQWRQAYQFNAGQFLTLRAIVDGEELRRSYSICISPNQYAAGEPLRVGIRQVRDGKFSNWAATHLGPGARLDVLTPDGRFGGTVSRTRDARLLGIAGGSGITPVLSIVRAALDASPDNRFTLIYGNRNSGSVMFLEEIEGLKNGYLDRLQIIHVLSDEPSEIEINNGLLDETKCAELLDALRAGGPFEQAFVCGPAPMMDAAQRALEACGLPPGAIHIERFGLPTAPAQPAPRVTDEATETSDVVIIINGKERRLKVPPQGPSILDVGLASGADLPYACKAGVCCTCRARLLEGEVSMERNFTLDESELQRGFVLTCQSHPVSEHVRLSFDER